jgi:hypothetical protein
VTEKSIRKMARSGSSICPICDKKRPLVEHHIHGRNILNHTASWNRAYICATCHDETHLGMIIIEGWVSTTDGKILAWRRAGEPQNCLEGANPHLYTHKANGIS